jgi:hypothetical protein
MGVLEKLAKYNIEINSDMEYTKSILHKINRNDLIEFSKEISASLPSPSNGGSSFRYLGNSSLSALPFPCSSISCRSRNFMEALQFSAIYADEFVLFKPFTASSFLSNDFDQFVDQFALYINFILIALPLIDRKILTFIDFHEYNYCESCFNKGMSEIHSLQNELDDERSFYFLIAKKFTDSTKIQYLGKQNGRHAFRMNGNDDFFDHESYRMTTKSINEDIRRELTKNEILSSEQMTKLGCVQEPATYLTNDIVYLNTAACKYNIPNISANNTQLSALSDFFGKDKFLGRMDVNYPYFAQSEISKILAFRDNEWHHLVDFRAALTESLASGQNAVDHLNNETAKIETVIRKNAALQNRRIGEGMIIMSLNAGITIATAGISTAVSAVTAALGGGHFIKKTLPAIFDRVNEPTEVRESKYYYAWKAKRLS